MTPFCQYNHPSKGERRQVSTVLIRPDSTTQKDLGYGCVERPLSGRRSVRRGIGAPSQAAPKGRASAIPYRACAPGGSQKLVQHVWDPVE
jgi:hypothetical protein